MHLVLAALFAPLAWGDLLPDPQEGMQYIDHHLEVTGLPEGQVLVVAADMPEVPCVVAFTSDGEQRLRSVYDRRCAMGDTPVVKAMAAADYASWRAAADQLQQEQEEACLERGEGCDFPSHFRPRLPWPAPSVLCPTKLSLLLDGPAGGPPKVTDRLQVTTLTADSCVLAHTPAPAPVAPPPTADPSSDCGLCTSGVTQTSATSLALGLGLVVVARRRAWAAPSS